VNINYLQTLLAVQEYGSFSAAARQIGLTQPAVSLQIQALEEEMGAQLVVRNARTCELTPAGLAVVAFAEDTFERLRQTRALLSQLSGEISGPVQVGASNIPGEYILPPLLASFRAKHPKVRFSLDIGDSDEIYTWLDNKRIDFGVVGQRQDGSKYEYSLLADDELLITVAADHPWAGQEVEPHELTNYPFIQREEGSGTRASYEAALRQIGVDPDSLPTVFCAGSTSAVLTAVLAGMGYAFCSQWALQNTLTLGHLATARIKGLTMSRGFYVVAHRTRFQTPAASELLSFLRRQGLSHAMKGEKE